MDGGNYVLNFGNDLVCLAWNASATELRGVLETLVGAGNVSSVSRDDSALAAQGGYSYNIQFAAITAPDL